MNRASIRLLLEIAHHRLDVLLVADHAVGQHGFQIDVANLPAIEPFADQPLEAHGVLVGEDELADRAQTQHRLFAIPHVPSPKTMNRKQRLSNSMTPVRRQPAIVGHPLTAFHFLGPWTIFPFYQSASRTSGPPTHRKGTGAVSTARHRQYGCRHEVTTPATGNMEAAGIVLRLCNPRAGNDPSLDFAVEPRHNLAKQPLPAAKNRISTGTLLSRGVIPACFGRAPFGRQTSLKATDPNSIRGRFERALAGEPVDWPVYAVYDWFVQHRSIDWPSLFAQGLGQINHANLT